MLFKLITILVLLSESYSSSTSQTPTRIYVSSRNKVTVGSQYQLCNLQIQENSQNGTNSTLFIGNSTEAIYMNVNQLRSDLFTALLPFTGMPVLLVRVTILKNDTLNGLVIFDVYPTNNGSIVDTDVTKTAVQRFCTSKLTEINTLQVTEGSTLQVTEGSTLQAFSSASAIISTDAIQKKLQRNKDASGMIIGLAVGIPVSLLGLLCTFLSILLKRKCSRRNKVDNKSKESVNRQNEETNLYRSVL